MDWRSLIPFLGLMVAAQAAPSPSPLFSDHAVLQRGVPVPVWGTADPGEKITVHFRNTRVATTTDEKGRWQVELPPMEVGKGTDFLVEGNGTYRAIDVAVGDVWICAGQSNMEFPVQKSIGVESVVTEAGKPWLRELKLSRMAAQEPQSGFKGAWKICTPDSVVHFSSVAYQFVRQLYRDDAVPVGILNLSYGGTRVEQWMSPDALSLSPYGRESLIRWDVDAKGFPAAQAIYEKALEEWETKKQAAAAAKKKFTAKPPSKPPGRPGHYTQPSALYFGMISPVEGFPATGFVWYQGESDTLRPQEYESLLGSFLEDVRQKWTAPKMPLFIVQLPDFDERKLPGHPWAQIRTAQARVADKLPDTSLIVTIDIGNPLDKHPTDKAEVGRRLALAARRSVFGEQVAAHSPVVRKIVRVGRAVEIQFETQGATLVLKEAAGERSFEMAGADGIFVPAQPVLKNSDTIILTSSVDEPAHIRYLQYDAPRPTLFTENGLPARPFALDL